MVLAEVMDFHLIDSQGEQFSLEDLKGKIWVVDFIFTTCSGICPIMSQHMSRIYQSYRHNDAVHLVSISVNPEYDSPEVLARYAQRYSADPDTWHFLTGSRKAIEDLAVHGFKVGSAQEPVFHSAYFILVDSKGRIRQYYEGTEKKTVAKIKMDIRRLLQERAH